MNAATRFNPASKTTGPDSPILSGAGKMNIVQTPFGKLIATKVESCLLLTYLTNLTVRDTL
jgi:hypothetical protein